MSTNLLHFISHNLVPSPHNIHPCSPSQRPISTPRQRPHSRSAPMQPLAPSPSRSPHSLRTSPRDQPVSIQIIAIATHLRSPDAVLRTLRSFTHAPTADRMTQKRTVHARTHSQPARLDSWFMRMHVPEPSTRAWASCYSAPYSTVPYTVRNTSGTMYLSIHLYWNVVCAHPVSN